MSTVAQKLGIKQGASIAVDAQPLSKVPLHRETLRALLAERGMDGVALISVDGTWSSMRVREL